MALVFRPFAALTLLGLLSLGACATDGAYGGGDLRADQGPSLQAPVPQAPGFQGQAYPVSGPQAPAALRPIDGLLTSPPNDARAGECFAKVVVPGQPIGAPPPQPRAVWVQTPPGPGQISPTWCIYYEQGAPQPPVAFTPERFGWIRVVCDKDATVEKIRHVQQRLHAWGDYQGPDDGHFDDATAKGVARFQEQRHIEHGGYLSVRTVEALDAAPPAPQIYASQPYPATYPQPGLAPCGQPACGQAPAPVVYAPPRQPQVIYAPPTVVYQRVIAPVIVPVIGQACGQPACQPPPCQTCAPTGYGQGDYGRGGYRAFGSTGAPPYRALLTWPGKTTY